MGLTAVVSPFCCCEDVLAVEFLTGRRGIISTWGGTAERLLTRAGHNVIAALVMAALVSLPASAQERVTLSALVGNPDQYDGKVIAVTGVVAAYRERRSREADPYTIFRLREGRASVVVIAWPHQGLRDGLRVQVTGTFVKVKTFLFIKAQSTIVLPTGRTRVPIGLFAALPTGLRRMKGM